MSQPRNRRAVIHPLAGADLGVYLRRYAAHRPYDRPPLWPRGLTSFALSVRWPFSLWERLRWQRAIERQGLPRDPVFIVGHWRSGTTHLHNLLSQDPRFGWLTLGQTVMPGNMLGVPTRMVYALLRRILPRKRSFDNVRLGVDAPQEEEIALGNLSGLSYFNCYYYPRDFEHHFRRAVLLEEIDDAERQEFQHAYRRLASKLSFVNRPRRLLFKNPASTARIGLLKELFPEARFIHIVRNPYDVFASSLRRLPAMLSAFAWQKYDHLDLESLVINCYRLLLTSYLAQVEEIPGEDLVETSYEAVVADPLAEVRRIYDSLGLSLDGETLSQLSRYLESLGDYQPNEHSLTARQLQRIESQWQFAFDRWEYPRRSVSDAAETLVPSDAPSISERSANQTLTRPEPG